MAQCNRVEWIFIVTCHSPTSRYRQGDVLTGGVPREFDIGLLRIGLHLVLKLPCALKMFFLKKHGKGFIDSFVSQSQPDKPQGIYQNSN